MSDRARSTPSSATYPGSPVSVAGVEDLHVEAGGPLRDCSADAPVPDDAQGRPVHVMRKVGPEAPAVPAALAEIILGRAGVPGGRQDQQEGQVGRRGIEDARGIAHRDAQLVRGGHVDVVVAHGGVAHHTEPARVAGLEHGGVDAIGQVAHDAVDVGAWASISAGVSGASSSGATISIPAVSSGSVPPGTRGG